jgi:cyclohexa-1,5-dienecarbonyl-CoA hydratase
MLAADQGNFNEETLMADFKFISYEDQGEVLRLAINRPPYNVLDIATMEEMNVALDLAMANTTAKVLVITGNGDKTFSSGVDVIDHTPDKVVKMIDVFHGILKRLMLVPIPTVAAVNGPALGGGCELAIACDMVVASESAKLGQPEIKLGVFPPIAAILLPRQMPMTKVMELLLGGGIIDAKEAHRIGLVNKPFSRGQFRRRYGEVPRTIHLAVARGPAAHQEGGQGSRHAALLRGAVPRRTALPART